MLTCSDEILAALRTGDTAALARFALSFTHFPTGSDPVTGLPWADLVATEGARASRDWFAAFDATT
jgi:hypothetical protein